MDIYKTFSAAEQGAKDYALRNLPITVKQTNPSDWNIQNSSTLCDCGETPSVVVTYFDPKTGSTYFACAGYCEACGK